jgi:hypothetical protein
VSGRSPIRPDTPPLPTINPASAIYQQALRLSGGVAGPRATITAIARYPQHIDAFVIGADQGIYSTWWDASSGWANWFRVTGGAAAASTSVTAIARYPDILDVFAVGTDNRVYTIWWLNEILFICNPNSKQLVLGGDVNQRGSVL